MSFTTEVAVVLIILCLLAILSLLIVAIVKQSETSTNNTTIQQPPPPSSVPAPAPASVPASVPAPVVSPAAPTTKEKYYVNKGWTREELVCKSLENKYGKGFPTTRPSFLLNPETGERLEYDCYNEELKIAAEHNGEHHYVFPNRFHKSMEEFQAQVRRDFYKYQLGLQHGIYQITVPYWVPIDMIPDWVEYHCPEAQHLRNRIENLKKLKTNQPS